MLRDFRIDLFLFIFLAFSTVSADAQNLASLDEELKLKGAAIAQYLKEIENVNSCGIGDFTGPKQVKSAGIGERLRTELEKHGISIVGSGDAKYFLSGRCRISDDGFGSHEMIVEIEIIDDLGSTVKNMPAKIKMDDGNELELADNEKITVRTNKADDIAKTVLVSTRLGEFNDVDEPVELNEKRKVNHIIDSIRKPKTHVAGTKIQTSAASPYALEIVVNGSNAKPTLDGGFYFAPMKRGDTGKFRFYNNSDHEVGIEVLVDGINSFNFSQIRNKKGGPKYKYYIVAPNTQFTVLGWHKNNEEVQQFKVTPHSESALAKNAAVGNENDASQEGVIAIAIHKSFTEKNRPKFASKGRSEDSMGFGQNLKQEVVEQKRIMGPLEEMIAFRYRK